MNPIILDKIHFAPNLCEISEKLGIKPGSKREIEIRQLIEEAIVKAKPKAMYSIVSTEVVAENIVHLDGKPFTSRVLCINLGEVHRAFPYVVTSGLELHNWKGEISDLFIGYLADTIISFALDEAWKFFLLHMTHHYGLGKTATMNPGSLEDWPIEAQTALFELLGDPQAAIGVTLTDSLLMVPRQSISGILFETERDFVNCQLCPREGCPNRRSPQDIDQVKRYFG